MLEKFALFVLLMNN